ncbi:hypothetical protein ABZ319_06910 [Nocardia sp. NPDC005978]|uniref:hypothetical protein n=1 Tax=Nocardia sp. NPDC005978 TaxID=3156725 RepID=UPI0033A6AF4D
MKIRGWYVLIAVVPLVLLAVYIRQHEFLCSHVSYGQLPAPEPLATDGSTIRVGELRSVNLGHGRAIDSDYRLDGVADVLEQTGTSFVWTDRCLLRPSEGLRFVIVRGQHPGTVTISPLGYPLTLHVVAN